MPEQIDTCLVNSEGVLQGLLQCVNNVEFISIIYLYMHMVYTKNHRDFFYKAFCDEHV